MTRPRVVVVGAGGFVGSAILSTLRKSYPAVETIGLDRASFDISRIPLRMPFDHADVVVNAAGSTSSELADLFATNVYGATALAKACSDAGVEHLVHLSSGSVLEGNRGKVNESAECRPVTSYALSRQLGEVGARHFGAGSISVVRLFYPYGRGQSQSRLIPRLTETIRNEDPVCVNPDGGPMVNLGHVDDVVHHLIRDIILAPRLSPITNLASDQIVSIRSIANTLASAMGCSLRFDYRKSAISLPVAVPHRPGEWRSLNPEDLLA